MRAQVIMLRGDQHSGKSTTIRLVYDMLLANGARVVRTRVKEGAVNRDFNAILLYNYTLVVFHSTGDTLKQVSEHLADVGICGNNKVVGSNEVEVSVSKDVTSEIVAQYQFDRVVLVTACRADSKYDKLINVSKAIELRKCAADDIDNAKIAKSVVSHI